MFLLAATYFSFDIESNAPDFLVESFLQREPVLYAHIFSSMIALIIGPFQFFLRRLTPLARRSKYLPLHRWLGRIYVTGALLGGAGGLYIAAFAFGGLPSALGFGTLAILLLITSSIAFMRIRSNDERSHREWMTRSYSLLFSAVTFRLWQPLLEGIGMTFTSSYIVASWLDWVPNLLIAELLINTYWKRQVSSYKIPATSPALL